MSTRANQLLLTALREYFLIKKNNQLLDQLQAILDSAIIREVCVGDFCNFEDKWVNERPHMQPAVQAWSVILDLFEGKDSSSTSSFWVHRHQLQCA